MEKDMSNGKDNIEEEGVPYDPREVDRRIKVMQQQRRFSYDRGYGMDYSPGAIPILREPYGIMRRNEKEY
jgi:hypothetical protein